MVKKDQTQLNISFDEFWTWLLRHPNCIIRVGTPDVIFCDEADFHWLLWRDGPEVCNVQLMRGKRAVAEMIVIPEAVNIVRGFPADADGEFVFELLSLQGEESFVSYFFVMSHGPDEMDGEGRIH